MTCGTNALLSKLKYSAIPKINQATVPLAMQSHRGNAYY